MKKIGLAVCYDTPNYGSQLQVLATIKAVERLGYETEIIRYKKKLTPVFLLQSLPRLFNGTFLRTKIAAKQKQKKIQKDPDIKRNTEIRKRRFRDFANHYFTNLSEPYWGWEELVKKSSKNYDGFLCGSDQLWLPQNLGSHFYTLEFAPDQKPKIAYATSFGVSEIPEYQRKRTARYLSRFQALSTREISGEKIIKSLTGREAPVVCDPTMLLDTQEWIKLIPDRKVLEKPYVFCYFLGTDESHRKAAEKLKEQTGLPLVSCPFLDNFVEADKKFGDIQLFDMDAADFINLIRHAQYILTDSFHGSIFSILNHKKFLVFDRFRKGKNSRNSRIESLCGILGLNSRRYQGDVTAVFSAVDYQKVEDRMDKLRRKSLSYLKKALSAEYNAEEEE